MCSTIRAMGGNKRYPRAKPPASTQRHCWVLATDRERGPWPGLILEWKKVNSEDWSARVVYVPDARESRSVEAWFRAGLLRPIDSWPDAKTREESRDVAHGGNFRSR
jgi:hypothetical protein